MPLFRSKNDIAFIKRINRELIEKVIGEKITYYPISKQFSQTNLYGESKEKIFDPPTEVYALVEWLEQDIKTTQFGQDIVYKLQVYILEDILIDIELNPKEGDVVEYDDRKFEIVGITEERQVFGRAGEKMGRSLECRSIRESQFKTTISGTIENHSRTRPDEPAPVSNFYDQVLFPYSASIG